jgi:hypothetical protein
MLTSIRRLHRDLNENVMWQFETEQLVEEYVPGMKGAMWCEVLVKTKEFAPPPSSWNTVSLAFHQYITTEFKSWSNRSTFQPAALQSSGLQLHFTD